MISLFSNDVKTWGKLIGSDNCSVIVYEWWLKAKRSETCPKPKIDMIYNLEQHECIPAYQILLILFTHLFIRLPDCFLFIYSFSSLYILDTNPISNVYLAKIFPFYRLCFCLFLLWKGFLISWYQVTGINLTYLHWALSYWMNLIYYKK